MVWSGESTGVYFSRSAYLMLKDFRTDIQHETDYSWIWRLPCTKDIRFFLWFLFAHDV